MILLFKSMVRVAGHMRGGVFIAPHIRRADAYAERAHTGQYRKGKPGAPMVPYIEHPRAVARILHEEAGVTDMVTLQAALLHDTMEDRGVSHENLVAEFGHDVADVVRELTNDADTPPGGKLAMQVAHAKKMSARAAAVKTADKTANLRDLLAAPPDWSADRMRQYYDDAHAVVTAMAEPHPVLQEIFNDVYSSGRRSL